jgi:hypothetical protein
MFPRAAGIPQHLDELLWKGAVRLQIVKGWARYLVRPVVVPVFMIGSGSDCDLVLADPSLPELHSYLSVLNEQVAIRHLGQGPPLQVGGQLVSKATLGDGDMVRLGDYEFQVHIDRSQWSQPADSVRWLSEAVGLKLYRETSHLDGT